MKRYVIRYLRKECSKIFKFDVNHQYPHVQNGEQAVNIVFSDSPRHATVTLISIHAAAKATPRYITVKPTPRKEKLHVKCIMQCR